MLSGGVASPTDRVDSTQFSIEEIRAAVAEAEAANRYVAGHAYTARAVNRGLEEISRVAPAGRNQDRVRALTLRAIQQSRRERDRQQFQLRRSAKWRKAASVDH